jgi:hypothetical protein
VRSSTTAGLESAAGGFDRLIDIGRVGLGHGGNRLTRRRIEHVELFA